MKRSTVSTFLALTLSSSMFAACDTSSTATDDFELRSGDVCLDIQLPESQADFAGSVKPGELFIFQGHYHYASGGDASPDPETFSDPAKRAKIKTFRAGDTFAVRQAGELLGAIKLIGSGDDDEPTYVATQGLTATIIRNFLTAGAQSILQCQAAAGTALDTCLAETGATGCCTGKYFSRLVECNLFGGSGPADLGAIWAAECESPSGDGGGADGGGADGGGDGNGGTDCGERRWAVAVEVDLGPTSCEYTGWVTPVPDGMGGCIDTYEIGAVGSVTDCDSEGEIDVSDEEIDDSCLPM